MELAEFVDALKPVIQAFKIAGPILQIISFFLPSPTDQTITNLIQVEFGKLNEKLDALDRKQISQEFNDLKATINDDILDREVAILQRIKVAYLEYAKLQKYQDRDNFFMLQERYTTNFR